MLTDAKVRNAKAATKPFKLSDYGGLYLLVNSAGKYWRMNYRFHGKQKTLSIGVYPDVSLLDARTKRDAARKQIVNGVDPSTAKRTSKIEQRHLHESTFKKIALEWHENQSSIWAESTASNIKRAMELDIFPWLGDRPIKEITEPELLLVLRKIESRGAHEKAQRVRSNVGRVFRYAIQTGRAERDPTTNLRGALVPAKTNHHASIIDPPSVAQLLRAIDGYTGSFITKCALQFAPLTFVRPGELRQAEWAEIDFDKSLWELPSHKMKMKQAHIVPLSHKAIEILEAIRPLTGNGEYIFPSIRSTSRPMSENTINAALRRLGYEKDQMSGHGFRAMARTILDEVLHIRPDFIEHQLSHAVRDPNGRAYNRTTYLPERREMMQQWADFLENLKN